MFRDERGTAAVEVAVLVPALLLFVGLLVGGGRLYLARGEVSDVASAAARAATLAPDSTGAVRAAHRAVGEQLSDTCAFAASGHGLRVDVDAAEFARPAGTRAEVRVSVHCDLRFDDLLLPGMPGRLTVTATGAHTLDSFRQRTPIDR